MNRRQFVSGLGAVGALTALGACTGALPAAGTGTTAPPQGFKSEAGSWLASLSTGDGCTLRGFGTFTPGGGVVTTGRRDFRRETPQGTGRGKRVKTGREVYSRGLKSVFDAEGGLVAIKEEYSTGVLNETGDGFSGTAEVKNCERDGDLVRTQMDKVESRCNPLDSTHAYTGSGTTSRT